MQEIITILRRGFQELFRYVYPGFLFLLLVKLAEIEMPVFGTIKVPEKSVELWSLIITALVVGFIIYSFHRFLVHEYILLALFALGLDGPGYKCKNEGKIPEWSKRFLIISMAWVLVVIVSLFLRIRIGKLWLPLEILLWPPLWIPLLFNFVMIILFIWKSKFFDYCKEWLLKRTNIEEGFSDYMFNRWANAHAIGMTFWFSVLMYMYAYKFTARSGLIFEYEIHFWIAILLLFFAWIWQLIELSYMERGFWEYE